jgi:hypothetical protein
MDAEEECAAKTVGKFRPTNAITSTFHGENTHHKAENILLPKYYCKTISEKNGNG